ncbi:MAG TPA: nuclear transport factor 2 family protein [Solirubrobacteraceae bacterium]|nr:nuclear transport factor 2 family protein [Solirubrobacteraceae bacterium]
MDTAETVPQRTEPTDNGATAQRFMRAMRERDYGTMADALAPDVVIHSPITESFQFRGRGDALAVLKIVAEAMGEIEHHELVGAGEVWTQRFTVRVRGRRLEGMDFIRFDGEGRLAELTVFMRPLPGLAAFAAGVAPRVGRRRGLLTMIALRLLIEPLALITRQGDRLVGWLLRDTWGRGAQA